MRSPSIQSSRKGLSMTDTTSTGELAREDRIRMIAHDLWEQEGRPDGRAEIHWFKACEIVDTEGGDPGWLKRRKEEPAASEKPAKVSRRRRAA